MVFAGVSIEITPSVILLQLHWVTVLINIPIR